MIYILAWLIAVLSFLLGMRFGMAVERNDHPKRYPVLVGVIKRRHPRKAPDPVCIPEGFTLSELPPLCVMRVRVGAPEGLLVPFVRGVQGVHGARPGARATIAYTNHAEAAIMTRETKEAGRAAIEARKRGSARTVYIVHYGEYAGCGVDAVFSSRDDAEAYARLCAPDAEPDIEEHLIDVPLSLHEAWHRTFQ